MSDDRHYYKQDRSIFWPLLLISTGVVWVMINQDLIEFRSLTLLFRFWPILLVIAGVQLIFGRRYPWIHNFFLLLIFGGMVYLLYKAEDFNLVSEQVYQKEEFEATGEAESMKVDLDIEYGTLSVSPITTGNELMLATVYHDGDVYYHDNEETERDIRLILENDDIFVFNFDWFEHLETETDIALTTNTLLDFSADMSSGDGDFQLGELSLERLTIENSSGDLTIDLPPGEYPANISNSSGNVQVDVANNTDMDIRINVSSGNVTIVLPDDVQGNIEIDVSSGNVDLIIPDTVGVMVTGDTSSGDISFDTAMLHIGDDNSGEWQTENYYDVENQVEIEFDISSGNLSIQ